jgi:DNA-binding SARP family transcriptional activator/predicted ATPase
LRLRLLGTPRVSLGDAPLTFHRRAALALLAYLAVTGKPHRREALATLLAGDAGDSRANKLLSNVLTDLRSVVGDHVLITRQVVALDAGLPLWVDVLAFRESLATGVAEALPAAIALHEDALLTGLALRDAPEFEDWLRSERERLQTELAAALQAVLDDQVLRGDTGGGIATARRLLALEPWREEAHRGMMLLLARDGQRSAALSQYETCRRALLEELGAEPEEDTVALYRRLAAAPRPVAHNLPALPGPCLGREAELATVAELLEGPGSRLVTLVGLGGSGKTRLALTAAARYAGGEAVADATPFPDGVFFVPLAEAAGERGAGRQTEGPADARATPPTEGGAEREIAAGIARALDLHLDPDGRRSPAAGLGAALRDRALLLVLDGMEGHVAGAPVLADLLQRAPRLRLLVTSRTRLRLYGERTVEVGGLALPESTDELESAPASALFLQSAGGAGQATGGAAGEAVLRLCRLVGGLPLALVLAAEWGRVLTPAELVADLERGLDLTAVGRDVPSRQASLTAILEDAWRRLTQAEQGALRRLAVFAGPFSRAAALEVAGAPAVALLSLADDALLTRDSSGGYALPALVRRQAALRLAAQPDEAGATHRRHAACYARFVAERLPALGQDRLALEEVARELANVRQAFSWAAAAGDGVLLHPLASGLVAYYALTGPFDEGAALLAAAPGDHGGLAVEGARLRALHGERREAGRLLEAARAQARLSGDRRLAPAVAAAGGWLLADEGPVVAARHELELAIVLAREAGLRETEAVARQSLGRVLLAAGEPALARAQGERLRRRAAAGSDRLGQARALLILGEVAAAVGAFGEAEPAFRESLRLAREAGARPETVQALVGLGATLDEGHGRHPEGQRVLSEAQTLALTLGASFAARLTLIPLARNARFGGRPGEARALAEIALLAARNGAGLVLEGQALRELAALALVTGEDAAALDLARQALDVAETLDRPLQQRQAQLVLGRALLALGQPAAGAVAFRRALALGLAAGAGHLAPDALAGLARAALARDAAEEAAAHVAAILERFSLDAAHVALRGIESPAEVCLTCYETLSAGGAERGVAVAVLAAGHRLLQERAAAFTPQERQAYLEGGPRRRAFMRTWREALSDSGAPPTPLGAAG